MQNKEDIVEILQLGQKGDGIADLNGERVFVPFSLKGEHIKLTGTKQRREISVILKSSSERVAPICEHFGVCGGCQLQHFEAEAYLDWKVDLLRSALLREEIDFDSEKMVSFPVGNRRRAVLGAIKTQSGLVIGFSKRADNEIIDLKSCPVLRESIFESIEDVRKITALFDLGKKEAKISLLECENGLDLSIRLAKEASNKQIQSAIRNKSIERFIRLSVNGEIVFEREKPILKTGIAQITPHPEAFVQASKEAEETMSNLVCEHLKGCKKVVDLFSGFGTFALRLAQYSEVIASENNADALIALDRAWRETGGKLKKVSHEKRDLYRRPFAFQELKKIDGIVFDPPRAGAELQSQHIAKSNLKKVAAVSCNPTTLARDIKILLEGGFQLNSITPIDQFRFTPHLETVALLSRA